jgi:hypothetical protein
MTGQRGQSEFKYDGIHLDGCGCPVRTAALQLWLTKVTAELDIENSERIKFNTPTLKVIEGGIEEISGHSVETLLQPRAERLEFTVGWALDELAATFGDQTHQHMIKRLRKDFQVTMERIAVEDTMVE